MRISEMFDREKDEFTLVCGTNIDSIQKAVESKVKEGWATFGAPYLQNFNIVQPMVRRSSIGVAASK